MHCPGHFGTPALDVSVSKPQNAPTNGVLKLYISINLIITYCPGHFGTTALDVSVSKPQNAPTNGALKLYISINLIITYLGTVGNEVRTVPFHPKKDRGQLIPTPPTPKMDKVNHVGFGYASCPMYIKPSEL